MTTTAPSEEAADPVPVASDLTVEEQAALTAGADMWHTAGVDRLGVSGHRRHRRAERRTGHPVHGHDLDVAPVRHRAGLDLEP